VAVAFKNSGSRRSACHQNVEMCSIHEHVGM
jgi:hypothetical protein